MQRWSRHIVLGCISIFALTLMSAALTGCNTVEGVGKDVKAAGGALEDAADGDD
ncbi:entericidin A/B family lipoprotein [Pyruvatibacter sp.]|uniref:entericidin A/B family lipoprotein n=1 Tax=Pyruvatibacter sp. TaxID=1981328 RepID=UPI0032EFE4C1